MIRRFVPARLKALIRAFANFDEAHEQSSRLATLSQKVDRAMEELGRIQIRQLDGLRGPIERHEFRVYSHAGEDGIIQFLTRSVDVPARTFVEFGVQDYREANTRFLALNNHWTGLILDGSESHLSEIRRDPVLWNAGVDARLAFVTRENVNFVLESAGMSGDIGLLSIDVDGNDYWIFDALTVVRPAIAVVEYNHRFGPSKSVTIPYDPAFRRRQTDATWVSCGASISAIVAAATRKGMSFVGCNTFGNNAFFVRSELLPPWLPELTPAEGYVAGTFRESMLVDGVEQPLTPEEEQALVRRANLVDV